MHVPLEINIQDISFDILSGLLVAIGAPVHSHESSFKFLISALQSMVYSLPECVYESPT